MKGLSNERTNQGKDQARKEPSNERTKQGKNQARKGLSNERTKHSLAMKGPSTRYIRHQSAAHDITQKRTHSTNMSTSEAHTTIHPGKGL